MPNVRQDLDRCTKALTEVESSEKVVDKPSVPSLEKETLPTEQDTFLPLFCKDNFIALVRLHLQQF